MSASSPNSSTSSDDRLSKDSLSPIGDLVSVCRICRIEPFTVMYLKIPVCTGCRAFFRRSIKHSKQYRCLNGRLCGQNALVPTRRACKFCRFQRCIELGMLESKLQLHSEERQQISSFSKKIPAINSNIFMPEAIGEILRAFTLLRRKTKFEFFAEYERAFACMRGGNAETSFVAEVRESPCGGHDMKLCHIEYLSFNRLARKETQLFEMIGDEDWEAFSPTRCSQYFHLFNRVLSTVRFKGHENNRSYNADGTYFLLDEDKTLRYWDYIYYGIEGEHAREIYEAIHSYMYSVTINLVRQVSQRVADAHLDEVETSALLFLLFTSPDCLSAVSPGVSEHLRKCRERMLRELAAYISSTGREFYQRLATIVFLTTEFQNLRNLSNHVVMLMYHASKANKDGILPEEFKGNLDRVTSNVTCQ